MSITAMRAYQTTSFEELRFGDYQASPSFAIAGVKIDCSTIAALWSARIHSACTLFWRLKWPEGAVLCDVDAERDDIWTFFQA